MKRLMLSTLIFAGFVFAQSVTTLGYEHTQNGLTILTVNASKEFSVFVSASNCDAKAFLVRVRIGTPAKWRSVQKFVDRIGCGFDTYAVSFSLPEGERVFEANVLALSVSSENAFLVP